MGRISFLLPKSGAEIFFLKSAHPPDYLMVTPLKMGMVIGTVSQTRNIIIVVVVVVVVIIIIIINTTTTFFLAITSPFCVLYFNSVYIVFLAAFFISPWH